MLGVHGLQNVANVALRGCGSVQSDCRKYDRVSAWRVASQLSARTRVRSSNFQEGSHCPL